MSRGISYLSAAALIAALSFFAGCSYPDTWESYMGADRADSLGRLVYDLEMSDTSGTYDISLYSRLDCRCSEFRTLTEFPLEVEFSSPSGMHFSEKVYIPLEKLGDADVPVHDFCVAYRSALVPLESGLWKMYIKIPRMTGLHGMGVILKHNQE